MNLPSDGTRVSGKTAEAPADSSGPVKTGPSAANAWFSQAAQITERLPAVFFSHGSRMALDALLCAASAYLAFQLRFDGSVPASHVPSMWALVATTPVLRLASLQLLGAYKSIWRYFNLRDTAVLAVTALPPTLLVLALRYQFQPRAGWLGYVPASVAMLEFVLFVLLAIGLRGFRRTSFELTRTAGKRVHALVVGNDETLPVAVRQVSAYSDIEVTGLLAPEPELRGMTIGGRLVLGDPAALARLLTSGTVDLILVADNRPDRIGAVIDTATEFGVEVRLLPSAASVIRGDQRVLNIPKPEELLEGRTAGPATPPPAVLDAFRDRVVLITGAGGSIGSELCRQTAQLPVSTLLLFDQDENAIFEIHGDLQEKGTSSTLVPLVGDIRDRRRLQQIFRAYRPQIVLHAAAYKHVPVMESNCCEAVLNNVLGTRMVAEIAASSGAELFLMISTDKAVRPAGVMGTSKRLAEMLVQTLAAKRAIIAPGMRFSCVRFGNVVGSRGSVVPIFLRQIAAGGPLTITHEEMTRYFMTIPEAVQLVLQAATLGSDGTIYMLDMGDPLKIMRLARKVIEMSGLRPDIDIQIQVVGTRPGEKLQEQLWTHGAHVIPTEFPRVLAVPGDLIPDSFEEALRVLEAAALEHQEDRVRHYLQEFQTGFAQQESATPAA
jgi:FlaA1/EpsC-like NDP-sugar epimerase